MDLAFSFRNSGFCRGNWGFVVSPTAGLMLLNRVRPLLMQLLPRARVLKREHEDLPELIQDAVHTAGQMIENFEVAHAGEELPLSSIVFYTMQRMKSGRRSWSGSGRDVLNANKEIPLRSVDEELGDLGEGAPASLHDTLASPRQAPDEIAGRHLDWATILECLPIRERTLLEAMLQDLPQTELAKRMGVSSAAISQCKSRLQRHICRIWRTGTPMAVCSPPQWRGFVRAGFENGSAKLFRPR